MVCVGAKHQHTHRICSRQRPKNQHDLIISALHSSAHIYKYKAYMPMQHAVASSKICFATLHLRIGSLHIPPLHGWPEFQLFLNLVILILLVNSDVINHLLNLPTERQLMSIL